MHSSSPHFCYISCQSHPSSHDYSNYIWRKTSYEAPHYEVFSNLLSLISLRFKYSPRHPVFKHPPSMYGEQSNRR
jgi:hypothetical protein